MSELSRILAEIEIVAKNAEIVNLRTTITGYRLLALIKGETK